MLIKKYKLILVFISFLFTNLANSGQFNAVLNIGDPFPSFSKLPSISNEFISSDDLTESIIVVVSLANHCPWVRGMDQDLIDLVNTFENHDVRVIGISMNRRQDDRLPAMKEHADKVGYNFDYIYDESQEFGRKLGATRTPEYFVFNSERKLVYMGLIHNSPAKMNKDGSIKYINGKPSEFYVENAIASTLNNNSFNPEETRAHGCTIKYVQ